MAVIYLQHPLHGRKVATSDMEANYDKGHGWKEFDPFVKVTPEEPAPVIPIFAPPPPQDNVQDIINNLLKTPAKKPRVTK